MPAVLDADPILAQQRRDFVYFEPRVVRVPNVRERVDAAPRHPRDEFAVVPQMQFKTVRNGVVPGHEVGNKRAPLERGNDAEWCERGESAALDSRIRRRHTRRKLRAKLFEQTRRGMDQSALAASSNHDRFATARDVEAVAFERDWRRGGGSCRVAKFNSDFSARERRVDGRRNFDSKHRRESARQIASGDSGDFAAIGARAHSRRGDALLAHSLRTPDAFGPSFSGGAAMIT